MADVTLADMLRGGIDGFDGRRRSLPGMKLVVDPSVFILGGEALSVEPPPDGGFVLGGVMRLALSGRHSFRLYPIDALPPPGDRFVEVTETPDGPAVRVFSAVHVAPLSDRDAEAAWTLPPDGKIGPETFAAPDGTPYRRDGGPGWQTAMTRYGQLDRADGPTESRRHAGHLYRRDTGLAAPAPETEWLWAEKIDVRADSWVLLAAGVQIDPSAVFIG